MAEIFLAETADLPGVRRVVVIKRMLPELARDEGYARMFLDEARIVASLAHPNIVQMVEVGRQDDDLFLVMEYIDGPSLAVVMEQAAAHAVPVPLEAALHVISGVLAGLHYVHERCDEAGRPLRLIHRDISPRNVLITWEGGVKIVDFGIARAENRLGTTSDGRVRGTVPYMSPEQCRARQLDRRTDIYSAAILLYELTLGQRLYDGESEFAVFEQIVSGRVRRPSAVVSDYPPRLEEVVLRGLAHKPADRFASAAQMLDALDAVGRELGLRPSARTLQAFLRAHLPAPSSGGAAQKEWAPATGATRTAEAQAATASPATATNGATRLESEEAPAVSRFSLTRPPRRLAAIGAVLAVTAVLGAGTSYWRWRHLLPVIGERTPLSTGPAATPPATEPTRPATSPEPKEPKEPKGLAAPLPPRADARPGPMAKAAAPREAHPAPTGEVVIDAVPWCQIAIDGKDRGPTPLIARLSAGPHQVRLRNAQYAIDRTTRILVTADRRLRRRFDFPMPAAAVEAPRTPLP